MSTPEHPYILPSEMAVFAEMAGKSYRKDNPTDQQNKAVFEPLMHKVNDWAAAVCDARPGFTGRPDRRWQNGWFVKSYLWPCCWQEGHSGRVFFVTGLYDGGLYTGLSYLRYDRSKLKALEQDKQNSFKERLEKAGCERVTIPAAELPGHSMESLQAWSLAYIDRWYWLYEELESMTHYSEDVDPDSVPLPLTRQPPPDIINSRIPGQRRFGDKNYDPAKDQEHKNTLGKTGEDLVLEMERSRLKGQGKGNLADQVCKQPDGYGYDILSFDESEKEIYIEVKSTRQSAETPFYMTAHEYAFAMEHSSQYKLYRLYATKQGNAPDAYYVYSAADLERLHREPLQFEISSNPGPGHSANTLPGDTAPSGT